MNPEFNDILEKLRQNKLALFIGAGVSNLAGLPLGSELTAKIKTKFNRIDQNTYELLDVCEEVVDTPPYNLSELYEYVKEELSTYSITDIHKKITAIDWTAIFTTNYDDIIENAYSSSEIKIKSAQSIFKKEISIDIHSRTKIYIYKIMGCIRQELKDEGYMVLTRRDYLKAQYLRREYLKLLFDYVKNGTMVFAGYSFKDLLVKDIIDQFIDIHGKDLLPWSYAIFPKPIPNDEKSKFFFSSRKIIPIYCQFHELIDFLYNNKTTDYTPVRSIHHIKVKGISIPIDANIFNNISKECNIITEEKIYQNTDDKDGFFKGTNNSWSAFKNQWDVKRTILNENNVELNTFVDDELKKFASDQNDIILLKGMAGTGKTMLLNRLAYNTYKNGDNPVISISTSTADIDYKQIATFIEYINDEYTKIKATGKHIPPIKFLITVDDAASTIKHLNTLIDYLTSRGRSVLIVAAERSNEWQAKIEQFPIKLHPNCIFNIDERVKDYDMDNLIIHFKKLGYLTVATDDIIQRIIIDNEYSFFAIIYSIVYPAQIPLNQIIKDQYLNLTEDSKRAFEVICCFSKYNIPMNMELLVRTLKISYNDFVENILNKDALKVIFQENDEQGNILYRAHHKIIAEKTLKYAFGDPEIIKNKYVEIFSSSNLSNIIERVICEKIIVEYLSVSHSIFSYLQKRELFEAITKEHETRSIMHHWGLLEMDNHNFKESEKLLKKSLGIPRDGCESYKGESDQNIKTSLGTLYSKLGIEKLKESQTEEANNFFDSAEELFSTSKYGEFPNVHAYHSHANMYLKRASECKNESEKLINISKSLEIINSAKDNCNDEDQLILALETELWIIVGDKSRITDSIENLRDKYKTPIGYFLTSLFHFKEAKNKINEEKENLLQLALQKLEKGLKYFPNDESCLNLKCKIFHILHPKDVKDYYIILDKWYTYHNIPNINHYFELGRMSFILGYFDKAKEIFQELEKGIGEGHKLRSTPREYIMIDDKPKFFEGTIFNIKSKYDGYIICNDLPKLTYALPFRPIACNFTPVKGELVKFNIAFSFRGPRSENIIKI